MKTSRKISTILSYILAAIMKDAPQAESAADFYDFMQGDFAKEVFEKYGFTVK